MPYPISYGKAFTMCSNGRDVVYLTPTHSNRGVRGYVTVQSLGGLTQVLPATDVP